MQEMHEVGASPGLHLPLAAELALSRHNRSLAHHQARARKRLASSMIDPRTAPLIGIDRHLPPVPLPRLSGQALRQRFAAMPPWQPELLRDPRNFIDRPTRHAAVLVPILLRDPLTVLLTRRADQLSSHAGQVAFPGGKVDDEDEDAVAAALREAEEEVGLAPDRVEVLGQLPDYLTGTAYRITPVVALVPADVRLKPNPQEVAELFEVPLAFLMDPANHRRHGLDWEGRPLSWLAMPYADGKDERFIWGATAALLRNLYRFLVA